MDLYIANLTRQEQDFIYRLPEKPQSFRQHIPIGSQIKIPGNLTAADIDAITSHHSKFGLVDAADIDRTKPFAGLCFCVDKRVPINKINSGIHHNDGVLFDRGVQQRKEAAVALNQTLGGQISDNGGRLNNLEVTIEEKSKHKEQEINETVAVRDDLPNRELSTSTTSNKRSGKRGRR